MFLLIFLPPSCWELSIGEILLPVSPSLKPEPLRFVDSLWLSEPVHYFCPKTLGIPGRVSSPFFFFFTGIPPPRPGMLRPPLVPPLGPAPPGLYPPAPLPNPGVLSAPPSLIQRPKADDTSAATIEKKATATISAKPQITNPKAEITRFVPTALRVRRENKGALAASQRKQDDEPALPLTKAAPKAGSSAPISVQTKDDVYEAFMKEMEGLL